MRQQFILFDLDGTLTDPAEGITNSFAYALRQYGIEVEDKRTLHRFIGPPLVTTFQEHFGYDREKALEATHYFRQWYSSTGWLQNIPYPGIRQLLQNLQAAGKTLVVATSKPEHLARKILEHFGLAACFTVICGAPMDESIHSTKATVIREAMARAGITDPGDAVMVGDRRYDTEGARENGIETVGILYGYGDRAEHEACQTRWIAATVQDLEALLLS